MSGTVSAVMNYVARNGVRPRYHANDTSRDVITIDARRVTIVDGRETGASLDLDGFELVKHASAVKDFTDVTGNAERHRDEIVELVKAVTGADHVAVPSRGILRFGEKSTLSGALNNSRPARFAHVDVSDSTAATLAARAAAGRDYARAAHFNVWRAISPPPQDVPLAFCDSRSVAPEDLLSSDAVFDEPGGAEWSFEGITVAHNPAHRWVYFSDMAIDDAVIFTTHDSAPERPHCVPHCAFDDLTVPEGTPPRASIEMRATAYWF